MTALSDCQKKQLVFDIFKQVKQEYDCWDEEYTRTVLESLAAEAPLSPLSFTSEPSDLLPSQSFNTITCFDYHANGGTTKSFVLPIVEVGIPEDLLLEPTPKYEFCGLSHQNVCSSYADSVDFVRYADDPETDIEGFIEELKGHECLSWQVDAHLHRLYVSDWLAIRLETTRRLLSDHGLTCDELDLLDSGPWLRTVRYKDIQNAHIMWPSDSMIGAAREILLSLHEETQYRSLLQDIELGFKSFCPNRNCLTDKCKAHGGREDLLPSLTVRPTINSMDFFHFEEKACGKQCFRRLKDEYEERVITQPDEDIESILRLIPDGYPCDLARICRMGCSDVFLYRRYFFPDQHLPRQQPKKRSKRRSPEKATRVLRIKTVCSCSGSLTACEDDSENCPCYHSGEYCHEECDCSWACRIGTPFGCKCSGSRACADEECFCRANGIECHPDSCRKCCATRGVAKKLRNGDVQYTLRCLNVPIQLGITPQIEVKRSQWGFGAFAFEDIPKRTFLGEYVGEIHDRRPDDYWVENKKRVNYGFELTTINPSQIDATIIGNHTRFLNDNLEELRAINTDAKHFIVNGQIRLGVYSSEYPVFCKNVFLTVFPAKKIKKGQELLLNYGKDYWKAHKFDEESEEEDEEDKMEVDE